MSLSDYAGKALLIEFFATSCPHCQAEAPHLQGLYKTLDTSRQQMVSINADSEGAPSVYAFHRYFGLPYPALLDLGPRAGSWHSPQNPGQPPSRTTSRAIPRSTWSRRTAPCTGPPTASSRPPN